MATLKPADSTAIREAAILLRAGGLVAFPTETVYGLGANALDPTAVARIFVAKGRPNANPLIVHVADRGRLPALVRDWPALADRLADAFWPGPLTLIVAKSAIVPDVVTGGGATVALRIPSHPVALELLREAGVPVAAPSANRSGELSPTTAEHVLRSLGDKVDLILDGGPCPGGLESTVVDVTGAVPRLLRPGLIGVEELERICGKLEVGVKAGGSLSSNATNPFPGSLEPLVSPGMLTRHYAPRTAVELAATAQESAFLANLYRTAGLRVAEYALPSDAKVAAANLYVDLHILDDGSHDRIIVTLPAAIATEPWRAVYDRLTRASAEE